MLRRTDRFLDDRHHVAVRDPVLGASPRILFWWVPPVGPDRSADIGRRMLLGLFVWSMTLVLLVIIIGEFVVEPA